MGSAERAERRAAKEKMYSDEVQDLLSKTAQVMGENKSLYVKPKRLLEIGKNRALSKPKRALRPLRKAYALAYKESSIASTYGDSIYMLTKDASSPEGKNLEKLVTKYKNSLGKGNLRVAGRVAAEVSRLAALTEYDQIADMTLSPSVLKEGDNACVLTISSKLEKMVTINCIEYSCKGADVRAETVMSRPLPAKSQQTYDLTIVPTVSAEASVRVIMRYTVDAHSERMQKTVFNVKIDSSG